MTQILKTQDLWMYQEKILSSKTLKIQTEKDNHIIYIYKL